MKTERLAPLTAKPTGLLLTIDAGIFKEMADRLAEAIGAVTPGNIRAEGVKRERGCVRAVFETGAAPADCKR